MNASISALPRVARQHAVRGELLAPLVHRRELRHGACRARTTSGSAGARSHAASCVLPTGVAAGPSH